MAGTQLYNKSGLKIYPNSEAAAVSYKNNNQKDVSAALDQLFSDLNALRGLVNGDKVIKESLGVDILYALNADRLTHPDSWRDDFLLPTSTTFYTWKKTTYTWAGNEITTKYEIVATALYPETQTLYCAIDEKTAKLKGPDWDDDDLPLGNVNIPDKNGLNMWSTNPVSVSSTSPDAYLSIRKRKASQQWGSAGTQWSTPAKYGGYAYSSTTEIRYAVSNNGNIVDPEAQCDDDGELNEGIWMKSLSKSNFLEGTSYVYQTYASKVGNDYTKIGTRYWAPPSLISIITK